jgi:hypothetical protein
MAMDEELDFFVKNCYAEPGITPAAVAKPEANERLQLIEEG